MLAALTMAETLRVVMSVRMRWMLSLRVEEGGERKEEGAGGERCESLYRRVRVGIEERGIVVGAMVVEEAKKGGLTIKLVLWS